MSHTFPYDIKSYKFNFHSITVQNLIYQDFLAAVINLIHWTTKKGKRCDKKDIVQGH
jgi:hypothetical protein